MTIDTARGCRPVFLSGDMTVAALDGTMLALEDEIRGFMIESFQVQLNDVRTLFPCGPCGSACTHSLSPLNCGHETSSSF